MKVICARGWYTIPHILKYQRIRHEALYLPRVTTIEDTTLWDSDRHNNHPYSIWTGYHYHSDSYLDPLLHPGAGESGLLSESTHYSSLHGGHGQGLNSTLSTGAPSIPYSDVSSFNSYQTCPAPHATLRRMLYCDTVSQVSTMDSRNVRFGPEDIWDAQAAVLGSMLNTTTGDIPPPYVAHDKAANTASKASAPKRPAHDKDKCCPICHASLGRSQERKRHKLSHLPHWLQCPDRDCSWRGGRWENLRSHRLKVHKVHPSSSQESDKCNSVIYDPWPLVEEITDDTTLEKARTSAITLVEKRAVEVGKSELWKDSWGRKRKRARKVNGPR